jgi:hypothetical protein
MSGIKSFDSDPAYFDFSSGGDLDIIVNKKTGHQWSLLKNGQLFDSTDSSNHPFTQSGTGAVARSIQSRDRSVIFVNDYSTVQQAVDALAVGGILIFEPQASYSHAGYINFTNKTNFIVIGNNAILKTANGTAVTAGNGGFKFTGCTDAIVEGLVIDENRSNRTPTGLADSMGVHVGQDCARMTFRDVQVKNAVTDGWYIYQNTGVSPTDILIDNCSGQTSYRNNMSIVGATRLEVRGGNYSGATGTAPQSGIDVEPDIGITNTDVTLNGCICSSNAGYGVQVGGAGTITRPTLINVYGTANTLGLLNASGGTDLVVRNLRGNTYSSNPTRSVVDFGSGIVGLDVDGVWLKDLTFNSTTKNAVYVHNSITGRITIRNIGVENYNCPALSLNAPNTTTRGVHLKNGDNASVAAIATAAGTLQRVGDVFVDDMAGYALYNSSTHCTFTNWHCHDIAAASLALWVDTGGDYFTLNNIKVTSSGAKANTNALLVTAGVLCQEINGFTAKDSGTAWTAANVISMNAASAAGAKFVGISPDPYTASGTGTITNGTTSIAVTHGLALTPAAKDIALVMTNNPTNDPGFLYADTFGSTQFTVRCKADPGVSTLTFSWSAVIHP